MSFPDTFETPRLSAERLTAAHFDTLRIMDADPEFMALLGGVRAADQTAAYLRNLRARDRKKEQTPMDTRFEALRADRIAHRRPEPDHA